MSDIDVIGLYQRITHRALRLETRQRYAVPWEDEDLAAWRRGEPEPRTPQRDNTMETLRLATESGRRIGRVRFVELPMTEYTRHEFEVAYPQLTEAGEEVHILDRALHPESRRHCGCPTSRSSWSTELRSSTVSPAPRSSGPR